MNQGGLGEEQSSGVEEALRKHEQSFTSIQGADTPLTKENLAKVDSNLDRDRSGSVSGSKSRSLIEEGLRDGNSSSGLSKVPSQEGLNSAGLSDIYVSSDAETEKLDLEEEDQSRATLSQMVESIQVKQETKTPEQENGSEHSTNSGAVVNGQSENNDQGHVSQDGDNSSNNVLDADNIGIREDEAKPLSEVQLSGIKPLYSFKRRSEDKNGVSEQVFKKPKLPVEPKVENNRDAATKNQTQEPTLGTEQDVKKPEGSNGLDEDIVYDGAVESELEDNNEEDEEDSAQKTRRNLENEDDEAEPEEEEDEEEEALEDGEAGNGPDLSPMEKEQLRQDALKALTKIEVDFAHLRQALYENKLAKLQNELQMCLDGSHPQLQSYYQKIASIRDFKLKRVYQRQKYELECIDKETKCTRTSIHQEFYKNVSDLRHNLLSHTTQRWYDINKERREMDVVVPEVNYHVPIKVANRSLSCITGYAAPAKMRRPGDELSEDLVCENIKFRFQNNPVDKLEVIVDRMRFNNELSDLNGLKKYYGAFPGAPELGGLKESEIYDDLSGIHQNQQHQLEQQHQHHHQQQQQQHQQQQEKEQHQKESQSHENQ